MKFLADMGISMKTVLWLRSQKLDVVHLREEHLQRMPDSEIMVKAQTEGRIILTMDLDFSQLVAASHGTLPSLISFRLSVEFSDLQDRSYASLGLEPKQLMVLHYEPFHDQERVSA
ncbi:MAG: DUF5615 family PIN-like protein [SAR324 cluster bacterium]|nr:DUF5615 family PIN-like protein [SAR324 cluster bacterium]